MSLQLKEVKTKRELFDFIYFPMKLYKNNPNYVPPLINEEKEVLDWHKNPIFKEGKAQATYYLAYKNSKIVGRIAAIINWKEVNLQKKSKVRFGWFDVVDDIEVTKALLEKVEELGKANNLKEIEGPVGFSNLDKAGLLTMGFDKLPTMVTLYNAPYYQEHLEKLGYTTASEWVEYEMKVPNELPEKVRKFNQLIKEKYDLSVKDIKTKKDLLSIVDPMFQLLDKTYGHLSSYVPIEPKQIQHYKDKYINFINTDFVSVIQDKNKKMIAFAITMPSYSKALQKAKGRLFPFGWYHFWKASKKNESAAFYLIGIDPDYQGKGVTAVVFDEIFKTFKKYGIRYIETNPELIENKNIQALWKDLYPQNHKRRKSFKKPI